MKTFVITLILGAVLIALFLAFWFSTPSIEELRQFTAAPGRYAPNIVDRTGRELSPYFTSSSQAPFVPLDSVPEHFVELLIFYEDKSFNYNVGFSPSGIMRSVYNILCYGKSYGSGSTLTQQTWRLLTKWKERKILRKVSEIVGSIKLTFALSKEEILEQYINLAHFGGPRSGLMAASQKYFDCKPRELTKSQSIMLVSFLNKPPKNILRDADQAYEKYQRRVQMLKDDGELTENDSDYNEIITGPEFNLGGTNASSYWLYLERTFEEINTLLPDSTVFSGGDLKIETTLDQAVNDSLSLLLDIELRRLPGNAKGAFILLNQDNEVICYVSGMNLRGQFDFLNSDASLPASRFKVPVCAVAIEKLSAERIVQPDKIMSVLLPTRFDYSNHHIVQDPGPQYITLLEAMRESRNAALCYLGNNVATPNEVVEFSRYFDLDLKPYQSIPLGTQGVSEFKLAWIYSTLLVRDGFIKRPSFIRRISTNKGEILYDGTASFQSEPRIVSSITCKILRQLLREAEQRGTSSFLAKVDSLELEDISPKTGTTRRFRQLGVTGSINQYTFSLLIQGKNMNQSAAKIAVPILSSLLQCMKRNGYF